jgi:hypothetical protein
MLTDHDLGEMIRTAATADERPSSILDINAAIRRGRRHRTYVRAAVSTMALTAITAVAVGTAGILLPSRVGPTADASVRAGQELRPPNTGLTLIRHLRFGWLPDGLDDQAYVSTSAPSGVRAWLTAELPPVGKSFKGVVAEVYPSGEEPYFPRHPSGLPPRVVGQQGAEPVDGQDAMWMTYADAPGSEAVLRWRHSATTWIQVAVRDISSPEQARAVVRRVAENLAVSFTERLALPFRIPELPAGLRPSVVHVNSSGFSSVSLTSAPASASEDDRNRQSMLITTTPHTGREATESSRWSPPNTTVDGRPASRLSDPYDRLVVWGAHGLNVDIQDSAAGTAAGLFGPDGCLSVYRALRF